MGNRLSNMSSRIYPYEQYINTENNFTNILIEHNPSNTINDTVSDTDTDTGSVYNKIYNVVTDTVPDRVSDIEVIKKKIIDKLPREIVEKIYREYIEPELYYFIYKDIICHSTSISLNEEYLIAFLPIILAKPTVCQYISIKCPNFKKSYIEHKINNKKQFKLMTKGQSFTLSILFSLYH